MQTVQHTTTDTPAPSRGWGSRPRKTVPGQVTECRHANHHPHGSPSRYNHDECRCPICVEGARRNRKRIAHQRARAAARGGLWTTARGTVRRMQALAAEGWGTPQIARASGLRSAHIYRLQTATPLDKPMLRTTAAKHAAMYEQLGALPPPTGPYAKRSRTRAAQHGWVPGLAWNNIDLDEQPSAAGQRGPKHGAKGGQPTDPHTIERIRELAAAGLSHAEIGQRIGKSRGSVSKICQRYQIRTAWTPQNGTPGASRKRWAA